MSKSLLNIYYRETLDKIDSYEEYFSSIVDTLDTKEWKKALRIDNKYGYESYLDKYANGIYKDEAQKKIDGFIKAEAKEADKRAWEKAKKKNSKKSYEKYLISYYNGIYSDEAKRKVDEFIRLEKEREIERAKERARQEKIEKEKKLALDGEKVAWELVCKKDTKEDYENYLKFYSNGIYRNEAKRKIDELLKIERARQERKLALEKEKEAWELVCKKNTIEDYENYLKFYPNGIYRNEAKKKIQHLEFNEDVEAWSKACLKNTYTEYTKYCQNFPNGIQFKEAKRKAKLLYKELTPRSNYSGQRLFTFLKNGKYGVVDITDKIILKAQYNQIVFLGNRYILVHADEYKQGLYTTSGKEIIALGNYNLRVDGGGYKTEIIKQHNPNDDFIVSAIGYDKQWIYNSSFMKMFDSSLIKIIDIKNDTFGYISNENKLLLKPIYTNIYLYKNGLGRIVKKGGKHGLCGLINNKFEIITDCNYAHIAWKSNNSNYAVIKNKDWSKDGIVNIKGEIVIPCIFNLIAPLENGYFIAHKGNRWEENGLIDSQGKIIIDVKYSNITHIEKEKIFLIEYNDKFGFANIKGDIIIKPELDEMYGGYNFDSYGHKLSNTKYKYLFFHGMEVPIKVKKDDKYGLIDKKGNYTLLPKYNYISFESFISENIYLYMIAENSHSYRKGFIIYNNERITIVFSENIDITYIDILNKNLIEYRDTTFGCGICTIKGKILLESKNPISYKFKKNKIIEEYKN